MEPNTKQCELTEYALELVYFKARQLVGKAGYTWDDEEDIAQDLIADLLERGLPQFNPAKATYNTFVSRLVERKIANLLRDRQAALRDPQCEICSLNEEINTGEEELVQRLATFCQDDCDILAGKYTRPAEERDHFDHDLCVTLGNLPPELRQIAEMLKTQSVLQIANSLGMPRRTFRDRYLKKLREAFEANDMENYVKRPRHTPIGVCAV